jgi:hypothetical protein
MSRENVEPRKVELLGLKVRRTFKAEIAVAVLTAPEMADQREEGARRHHGQQPGGIAGQAGSVGDAGLDPLAL